MKSDTRNREDVLNEIGRGFIEMKNNRARGYMVLLHDNSDKMSIMVYNMDPEDFLDKTIKIVEDTFGEMEGEND